MVRTGQEPEPEPVRRLAYRSPRHPWLPVEVIARHELLDRYGEQYFRRPERLDFFMLVLVTGGHGEHEVDVATVGLQPGTVLLVRPGQVHRHRWTGTVVADLVVFPPGNLRASTRDRIRPVGSGALSGRLGARDTELLHGDIDAIRTEQERFDGSPRHADLLRARLDVVLLQVAACCDDVQPATARSALYTAFCELLEARFATTRRAQDYATALGYSRRTLNRACELATGRTAKDLADQRVALEAQRLLTGSDIPVEQIAAQLGFSEATNFGKFFHRTSGTAPGDFRSRHR